jgi:hypothetical protein
MDGCRLLPERSEELECIQADNVMAISILVRLRQPDEAVLR